MKGSIEIVVAPNGQSTVKTQGFSGATCRDASRFLEQALGKTANERLTGEFYQTQLGSQSQQQRF